MLFQFVHVAKWIMYKFTFPRDVLYALRPRPNKYYDDEHISRGFKSHCSFHNLPDSWSKLMQINIIFLWKTCTYHNLNQNLREIWQGSIGVRRENKICWDSQTKQSGCSTSRARKSDPVARLPAWSQEQFYNGLVVTSSQSTAEAVILKEQ